MSRRRHRPVDRGRVTRGLAAGRYEEPGHGQCDAVYRRRAGDLGHRNRARVGSRHGAVEGEQCWDEELPVSSTYAVLKTRGVPWTTNVSRCPSHENDSVRVRSAASWRRSCHVRRYREYAANHDGDYDHARHLCSFRVAVPRHPTGWDVSGAGADLPRKLPEFQEAPSSPSWASAARVPMRPTWHFGAPAVAVTGSEGTRMLGGGRAQLSSW